MSLEQRPSRPSIEKGFNDLLESTSALPELDGSLTKTDIRQIGAVLREVDVMPNAALGTYLLVSLAAINCHTRIQELNRYRGRNPAVSAKKDALILIAEKQAEIRLNLFPSIADPDIFAGQTIEALTPHDNELPSKDDLNAQHKQRVSFSRDIIRLFPDVKKPYKPRRR